jgi:8-oxo-dGTP diphosphatase
VPNGRDNLKKMIEVAAAIIRNNEEQILICQRGAGGSTAFLWEFPGGKRESDENLEECLARECFEELGIEIHVLDIFDHSQYKYPEGEIAFTFFAAEIVSGKMTPAVHERILWADAVSLNNFEFCPADVGIIRKLMSKK